MSDQAQKSEPIANVTLCRGCGMKIEFIRGPNGEDIPAQKIRTVYTGQIDLTGAWELVKEERLDTEAIYVSHFETCPNAKDFTRTAPGRQGGSNG